jgi:hypothetical protein
MPKKQLELPLDQRPNHLMNKLEELRAELRLRSPEDIAACTGASYKPHAVDGGEFTLPVWGEDTVVSFPNFAIRFRSTGQECGQATQALIMYYFISADGIPLTGRYIAFSELPDGRFYSQAFQGYTGHELARKFGSDPVALQRATANLGGIPQSIGNYSALFQLFPHVTLLIVYWQGDEDFPTNCQILFDAATASQLPTDACAIAGSMLTRKLFASV